MRLWSRLHVRGIVVKTPAVPLRTRTWANERKKLPTTAQKRLYRWANVRSLHLHDSEIRDKFRLTRLHSVLQRD